MKKGIVFLFGLLISIHCFAQDNSEIANVYFKKSKTSFDNNNLEKATDYLTKTVKYYDGITKKDVAVFGTKLYVKTKQYLKAHKFAKQYFVLAKNKKNNQYTEMLLLFIDIKDAIEDDPDLEVVEVVEDEVDVEETIIETEVKVDTVKIVNKPLVEEVSGDIQADVRTKPIEEFSFVIIEEVPVFPGCSGSRKEKSDCLNINVRKHLAKNFNSDLPSTLGLPVGIKRIQISFLIDNNGNVANVNARAPHPELKKEAIRIASLLPKMIPGTQRGKAVSVKYSVSLKIDVK